MRYSQTPEEIRAQIALAFSERERAFRPHASDKPRVVTGVQDPYKPRPVVVRDCTNGEKSISPQAQAEAISQRIHLCSDDQADELRFMVYGAYTPDNPNGLRS